MPLQVTRLEIKHTHTRAHTRTHMHTRQMCKRINDWGKAYRTGVHLSWRWSREDASVSSDAVDEADAVGRPGSAGLMNSECEGLPRKTYKQRTGLKDIQGSLKTLSGRQDPPPRGQSDPFHLSNLFNASYSFLSIQSFLSTSSHSIFPVYIHPFTLSYILPSIQSFLFISIRSIIPIRLVGQ